MEMLRVFACAVAFGCGWPALVSGQAIRVVTSTSLSDAELETSNGDKIVRDRWNRLHAVHRGGSTVVYRSSVDGQTWGSPVALGTGEQAAIAVDHAGNVGVAFVANGTVFYVRRPVNGAFAAPVALASGLEVALAARNAQAHLVWSTGSAVRYLTFPTATPPAGLQTGELIAQSGCPNTAYSRPAITLIDRCTPTAVPVVAFLFASDEQTGSTTACAKAYTEVGPLVFERQAASTWNSIYTGVRSDYAATSSVEAVSLSLSADFAVRDVFLAFSDVQSGLARSVLAKGSPLNFQTVQLDNARRHLHVRAANDLLAPRGRFRLAWAKASSSFPNDFFGAGTAYQEGQWTGTGSLTWAQNLVQIGTFQGGGAGRPQAFFWDRLDPVSCTLRQSQAAYYEIETSFAQERLVTYEQALGSWPVRRRDNSSCSHPLGGTLPVLVASRAVAGTSAGETWVSLEDAGRVLDASASGLIFETFTGDTVEVTWAEDARLQTAWGEGFVLEGPADALRFVGGEGGFELVNIGELPPLESGGCDPDLGECPEAP